MQNKIKSYRDMVRTLIYKVSKKKAVEIAMNHNCVSKEIAEKYTDSELEEVLKHASNRMYKLVRNW